MPGALARNPRLGLNVVGRLGTTRAKMRVLSRRPHPLLAQARSLMFGMSLAEIAIIVIVALVVVGPERLPELARNIGRTLGELRRAGNSLKDAIMFEAEKQDWQDNKAAALSAPAAAPALGSEPPSAALSQLHAEPPPSEPYDPYMDMDMEHMGPIDQWDDDDDFFLSAPAPSSRRDVELEFAHPEVDPADDPYGDPDAAPARRLVALPELLPVQHIDPSMPWHDEIHPERRDVFITPSRSL